MSKAIKLLVSGYEASGKSTLTSQIKDALIINFDRKEYPFLVPHANFKDYRGMNSVTDFINEKIGAYKEKFKKYPKFIVIDTVTQMYAAMAYYNSVKYNGFDIHKQNNLDTAAFNAYIEDILLPNGVSAIIVGHTIINEKTGSHTIPAQGNFAQHGSWSSVVNDSIFIEKSSGKLIVYLKALKLPARTTLKEILGKDTIKVDELKVPMAEFDINKYLDQLTSAKTEAEEYIL